MASRQGVKTIRREKAARHKPSPARDALNRAAWNVFCKAFIKQGEGDRTRLNGYPITEADKRALYRWRHEGAYPSIWTADKFLIRYGMILDDYFVWCEDLKVEAWANGVPDWWDSE